MDSAVHPQESGYADRAGSAAQIVSPAGSSVRIPQISDAALAAACLDRRYAVPACSPDHSGAAMVSAIREGAADEGLPLGQYLEFLRITMTAGAPTSIRLRAGSQQVNRPPFELL